MTYTYSDTDRLLSPLSYMYTAFEGTGFLTDFRASRYSVLTTLLTDSTGHESKNSTGHLLRLAFETTLRAEESGLLHGVQNQLDSLRGMNLGDMQDALGEEMSDRAASILSHNDQETIHTPTLVRDLANALCRPSEGWSDQTWSTYLGWMDRLVQRFEVTKRLHERYGPGLRKGKGPHEQIEVYVAFSHCLAAAYLVGGKLRYLNCLLKVNDLLCSSPERYADSRSMRLAVACGLVLELGYVNSLILEKAVSVVT